MSQHCVLLLEAPAPRRVKPTAACPPIGMRRLYPVGRHHPAGTIPIGIDHKAPGISTDSARGPEMTGNHRDDPDKRHTRRDRTTRPWNGPPSRVNDRYIRRSGLPNIKPCHGAPDQHPLDLRGALEDREDPGGRGSLRRSAACMTPWYQHGFSTGCSRVATVPRRPRGRSRTRSEREPRRHRGLLSAAVLSTATSEVHLCADLRLLGLQRGLRLRQHDRKAPPGPARAGRVRQPGPNRPS